MHLKLCWCHRLTEKEGADGMMVSAVRPYLMDLGSANGTYLNNEQIEAERYYELLERVSMIRTPMQLQDQNLNHCFEASVDLVQHEWHVVHWHA